MTSPYASDRFHDIRGHCEVFRKAHGNNRVVFGGMWDLGS